MDGTVEFGESCDDGDADDTNECNNSCKINTTFGICGSDMDCAAVNAFANQTRANFQTVKAHVMRPTKSLNA